MLEEKLAVINKYSPGEFNFTIVTKTFKRTSPKVTVESEALCIQVKSLFPYQALNQVQDQVLIRKQLVLPLLPVLFQAPYQVEYQVPN